MKNMFFKKFLSAIAFISIATAMGVAGYLYFAKNQPALAQIAGNTYYIDYMNGSDSNNGISPSTPWKHSPGDPRVATNANITLAPGDIIVFKGGVMYSFDPILIDYIGANASGIAGKEIIYRSGHLQSPIWGNTRAIIDGTNINYNYAQGITGVISLKDYSYIRVEGLQIQYAPWANAESSLIGWKGSAGGNITLNDNELFSNISPANSASSVWVGIWVQGNYLDATPTSFIITNNHIHDIGGHGILLRWGMTNVLLENNIVHDCGPDPAPYQGDGVFLRVGGNSAAVPTNVTVRKNEFYDFPVKGCIIIGGLKNGVIERNKCYDVKAANGFGFALGGSESVNSVDDVTFRNNLITFNNQSKWGGLFRLALDGGSVSNIKYYNNTLIGAGSEWVFKITPGIYSIQNLDIRNNLISGSSQYYFYITPTTAISNSFVSDNNLFFGGGATPFYHFNTAKNLTTWQNDANQDTGSINANPLLNPDHSLSSASSAINKGVAFYSFLNDYDNISRPQGSAWDIGAYEYIQAPPPLKGDFNSDSKVNGLDFTSFKNAFKSIFNTIFDLNSDNTIDVKDLGVLMSGWLP